MSPLLFIVCMDRVTEGAGPDPKELSGLFVAGHQSLFYSSRGGLRLHKGPLGSVCQWCCMNTGGERTVTMTVERDQTQGSLSADGGGLSRVWEFGCLGIMFIMGIMDGGLDSEMAARVRRESDLCCKLTPIQKRRNLTSREQISEVNGSAYMVLPESNMGGSCGTKTWCKNM